ncbi:MAG TPA: hypothetical protein VF295_08455 [Candidatus Limnocylindria bacterium]
MSGGPARRVAETLDRRGLAVPARLFADAHRPLAPLLSDLGVAFGPLLGAAFGRRTADASALLEDEDGLDRLIDQLDRRSQGAGGAEPD